MDLNFFDEVKKYGGKAYFVGGILRDKILGMPKKDIDIEVMGLQKDRLYEILCTYGKIKFVENRKIFLLNGNTEIFFNTNKKIDLLESARRRDLTINSLYYDPLEDKLYDFLGGVEDVKKGILKFCNEKTFMDDPVRILRVAYFYGKYGFSIDENLEKLIIENKNRILEVSKERIFSEFEKILFLTNNFLALEFLEKTGILELIIGKNSNIKKLKKKDRLVLWTILALGSEIFPYYFMGDKQLIQTVEDLKTSYEKLKGLKNEYSVYELKKIAVNTDIKVLFRIYYELHGELKFIKKLYKDYWNFKDKLSPLILGRDLINLGFTNNKEFGKILANIYDMQLQGEFRDKIQAINYVKNRYKEFTKFS